MKRIVILTLIFLGILVSSVAAQGIPTTPQLLVLNGEIPGYARIEWVNGVPTLLTNLPGVTLEVASRGPVQVAIIESA